MNFVSYQAIPHKIRHIETRQATMMTANSEQPREMDLDKQRVLLAALDAAFSDRQDQLAVLEKQLARAHAGRGSFVLLHGETGIGKRALLRVFGERMQQESAVFLQESFHKGMSIDPYAPFLRIVERLSEQCRRSHADSDHEAAFDDRGVVAAAEPIPVWEAKALYDLQTKYYLARQNLLAAILGHARENTLVVAFHGFDLAPQSTWQFIHLLCESLQDHKLLLIVVLPNEGKRAKPGESPHYNDILQRMNRERLVTKISLNRFGNDELRNLLYNTFHRMDFTSNFVPALLAVTEGVPARIKACLVNMYRQGFIYEQAGIWFNKANVDREVLLQIGSEQDERVAIHRQLVGLQEADLTLMRYAACMKDVIDVTLLASLLQRPLFKILRQIEGLTDMHLLTRSEDEIYKFDRSFIPLIILGEMTDAGKKKCHLEIARAIEASQSYDPAKKASHLYHHFSSAQEPGMALRYLISAMQLSIRNLAFWEARDYLLQVAQYLDCWDSSNPCKDLLHVFIQAGWLERVLGNWHDSSQYLQKAWHIVDGLDDDIAKIQILIQEGLTYFRLNDWENAEKCLTTCIETLPNARPFDLSMAHYGLGNISFELAQYDLARQRFERALELAREANAQQLVANIYNNLGALDNVQGQRLKAIFCYSQSIAIFNSLGDKSGLARAYHNIGMTHADEQSWRTANDFYGKSLAISDALGLIPLKAITFLNRAHALVHLHEFSEANEYNYKAARLLKHLHDELGMAEYHKIQGGIEREQGNLKKAKEHLQKARAGFQSLENKLGIAETEYECGLLARSEKDFAGAQDWLQKARQHFLDLGIDKKAAVIDTDILTIQCEQPDTLHVLQ